MAKPLELVVKLDSFPRYKDGGVLIGKVYGHLANENRKAMAKQLNFGSTLIVSLGSLILGQYLLLQITD